MRKSKIIILIAIFIPMYFWGLNFRPLALPDEGRYAEIPREIAESKNFVTPTLNGVMYFEKPPLAYWLNSFAISLSESNFSCRFFNAFFALMTILLVFFISKKLYDENAAFCSTLALGTSTLFFGHSQILTLDMTLTFFLTATLLFVFRALNSELKSKERKYLFWTAYAFMACAVMSKGLIGLILPIGIVGLWIILNKQWQHLRDAHFFSGCTIFLLICLPWHIALFLKNPDGAKFYLWHEHFERFLKDGHNRNQAMHFLPLALIVGFLPWTFFLPNALFSKELKMLKAKNNFFLIWALTIFIFFHMSKSQLIPYILPCLPPLAIITGNYLSKIKFHCLKNNLYIWSSLWLVASIAAPIVISRKAYYQYGYIHIILAILLFCASITSIYYLIKQKHKSSFSILLISNVALLFIAPVIMAKVQKPGTLELANYIKAKCNQSPVFCVYEYFQDLPFYLKRKVGIIGHIPEEQAFGHSIEKNKLYLSVADFKQQYKNKKTYLIVRKDYFNSFKNAFGHSNILVEKASPTLFLLYIKNENS